jgi:hypothetical protein
VVDKTAEDGVHDGGEDEAPDTGPDRRVHEPPADPGLVVEEGRGDVEGRLDAIQGSTNGRVVGEVTGDHLGGTVADDPLGLSLASHHGPHGHAAGRQSRHDETRGTPTGTDGQDSRHDSPEVEGSTSTSD